MFLLKRPPSRPAKILKVSLNSKTKYIECICMGLEIGGLNRSMVLLSSDLISRSLLYVFKK